MRVFSIYILSVLLCASLAANPSEIYTNYINSYNFDVSEDHFLVGLGNGFVVQDKESGEYDYYNSMNSNLSYNSVNDIIERDGKIFVSTKEGLFTLENKTVKKHEILTGDVRDFVLDTNGDLWTYSSDYLFRIGDSKIDTIKISDSIEYPINVEKFEFYKDKIWVTFTPRYSGDYYSRVHSSQYKFALIERENNNVITFPDSVRGFSSSASIKYSTISNKEVWVGISYDNAQYIYNIEKNEWRENEYLKQLSEKYELVNWYMASDSADNIWFAVSVNSGDAKDSRLPAKFNYDTKEIEVLYEDLAKTEEISVFYIDKLGSNIVYNGGNAFYIPNGDELKIIRNEEINESEFHRTNYSLYKDDIYFLIRPKNFKEKAKVYNLTSHEYIDYSPVSKTPYHSIGSYIQSDDVKIIIGHGTIADPYFYYDGKWKEEGLNFNFSQFKYEQFSDGKIVFRAPNLRMFRNNENKPFTRYVLEDKYIRDNLVDFEIKNDKLHFLGYYTDNNGESYETFISILDQETNILNTYSPDNSCLPDFELEKVNDKSYFVDTIPREFILDKHENYWIRTSEGIIKTNGNDCEKIEIEGGGDGISNLSYSPVLDKVFALKNDSLVTIDDKGLTYTKLSDLGINYVTMIKSLQDGYVYLGTANGELFKILNENQAEEKELLQGKDNITTSINDVSYHNDTTFISTSLGILKYVDFHTSVNELPNKIDRSLTYPNPASNYINIVSEKLDKIELYDITGNKLLESNRTKIDISDLSAGVYFIKITDFDNEVTYQKIIKRE